MSEIHGGELTARQLKAAGIDTIFGVVAGPMVEVLAGAARAGLRVVGCRHEESAAFMASAWGYQRRLPGVVVVGSGPGMTNAVTPMYVATASGMPLVVLGGSASAPRGIGAFQEADQVAFARPGCKWVQQIDRTEHIPELLHLALGKAVSGRPGAVYLDYPGEMVNRAVPEDSVTLRTAMPAITRPYPDPAAIERIAGMLARAERPLVLVGKGAAWADAGAALTRLVDRGLPYVASPMARGVIPDDNPHCVNDARSAALARADAIVMVGGRFNWIFNYGRPPRYAANVRIAQIDIEPEELYSSAAIELGVVADAAVASEQLCAALEGRALACARGGWLDELRARARSNAALLDPLMGLDSTPINPFRLARELRDVLPRNATICDDGELIMGVSRTVLPSFGARSRLNAGTTACIGTGVPYAIGAALAQPDRPAVALLGDYAFGAAAIDIETAARVGARTVFVVANNSGIAGHLLQNFMFPPDAPPIARLHAADYEKMMEMVGGHAERVERPEQIRPALERALAAGGPALVHVLIDPLAVRPGGMNFLE